MGEGLSAHAVLLPSTGNLQVVVASELQGIPDLVFIGDTHNAVDSGLIQVAGVVDEASALFESEGRGLGLGEENGRFLLFRVMGEDKIAFFLFIGSGGVVEDLSSPNDQERCDDENERQQQTTRTFHATSLRAPSARTEEIACNLDKAAE